MRIAVVSDIHGNRTAFEAVVEDLRKTAPDLVLHGGDLAHGGSSPAEIVDRVRELGWRGVMGNADELLFRPESLTEFAARSPRLAALFQTIGEMAEFTREVMGDERLTWLSNLSCVQIEGPIALVHASPESEWVSPGADAADAELERVYGPLGKPVAVYAHIHCAYIRGVGGLTVANTGSVSLSFDGDPRAAYLLVEDGAPSTRRVEYDVEKEMKLLGESRLPHADWVAKTLAAAHFVMP
jgi:predicted phosphodiesterase